MLLLSSYNCLVCILFITVFSDSGSRYCGFFGCMGFGVIVFLMYFDAVFGNYSTFYIRDCLLTVYLNSSGYSNILTYFCKSCSVNVLIAVLYVFSRAFSVIQFLVDRYLFMSARISFCSVLSFLARYTN